MYYCFEKSTGCFAGQSHTFVEDSIFSCTSIPCPYYNPDSQKPIWEGDSWTLENISI